MLRKSTCFALALTVVALPSCSSQREDLGGASLAIVGGTADTDHAAVMAAGHQVGAGQFCSAYLITPDLVLTAHHCTADPALLPSTVCTPNALLPPSLSPSTLLVVGGPSSSTSTSLYSVAKVHNLPDLASRTLCGNDVAVLQLSKPISGVEPLGLRLNAPPEQDEELTLVGYGQTSLSDPNSVGDRFSLSGARVDHVGYEEGPLGTYMVDGDMSVDIGPCAGDSGGPALDLKGQSVGVMSRGPKNKCTHMVYTRVDAHADWLRTLAQESAQRLGIATPAWAQDDAGGAGGATGGAGGTGGAAGSAAGGAAGQSAAGSDDDGGCSVGAHGRGSARLAMVAALLAAAALRRRAIRARA
jgi:hypothetical protein